MRFVLATGNPHKLREFADLLRPHELINLPVGVNLPAETGETFAANAAVKARFASDVLGIPAIADDSGIVVPALGGAPGVRSARFAGPDATDSENLDHLIKQCSEIDDRSAEYVCALALAWPDGRAELFEGTCKGTLILERRGKGGFGYDPSFVPGSLTDGRTMAELKQKEKDAISHRGEAARRLLNFLARED